MGKMEDTRALVEAAADTMRWIDEYTAEVTVDGRMCHVRVVLLRKSVLQVSGVEVLASLGGRPLRFDLGARGVTVPSLPTLTTGDTAFDERFVLQGQPIEACVAAFDAEVRRWATERFPTWPSLGTADGNLRLFHQTVSDDSSWSTSPEDLRSSIGWTLHLADRLTSEFDRAYDEVRRSSGEAAAGEWMTDLQSGVARHARRRTLTRAVLFSLPLVVLLLSALYFFLTIP